MSDAKVTLFEVGPRDGLQNESRILPLYEKLELIRSLTGAGLTRIEAGAFVRADRVPQMADSDAVQDGLRSSGLTGEFYFLVPNRKGLARAIEKGVKHIAVFTAVSEEFNRKNIGMGVDDSFREIEAVVTEARMQGIRVRGYVSTVFGCPFQGRIDPKLAIGAIERMAALPVEEVSVGDTIGVAAPKQVSEVFGPLIANGGAHRYAAHFHDTRGTALSNAVRALELGIRTFDSSVSGLGGCPFAPGASGNLATEDLVYFLKENGMETGVDYRALCETGARLSQVMGYERPVSRALQAYLANCTRNSVWDS
jgi:hydroxymethylglutaryl-CoA lyase